MSTERESLSLLMRDDGREFIYDVELSATEILDPLGPEFSEALPYIGTNAALITLQDDLGLMHGVLNLAERPPMLDEQLTLVMHSVDEEFLVVTGPECKVSSVETLLFHYSCDSATASAGAPVLADDGSTVLEGHVGGNRVDRGIGIRADVLRELSESP